MVGIVILNYISYIETINCIDSILNTYSDDYKIYIVDNNSPNESFIEINKRYGNNNKIKIIQNNSNLGYAAGNNIGIKMALDDKCEYITISNSDIIFHDNSIKNMCDFINNNKNIGIVGPKVVNEAGEIEKKSRIFRKTGIKEKLLAGTKFRVFNIGNIYTDYYGLDIPFDVPVEVYTLLGACFTMSKEIAELITPFDENTFLYEEEVINGIKAASTGLKTYFVPTSVVTHKHAASSKHIGAFVLIHLVNSEIYYCKTYLKAPVIKILPIYLVRVMLYLSRCIKDPNYRKNLLNFIIQTQDRLWSKEGLGRNNKHIIRGGKQC